MALEARPQTRSGDEGMLPLYNMAAGFVHATIPNFILDYLEQNGTGSFLQDWSIWITFLIGFLVCVTVGILYVIVMPIAGCCVCSCRTCCKRCRCCSCCRKKPGDGTEPAKPSPPTKYKQRSCTIFLAIFTSMMFSAVVVNFVALSQMRYEISPFGFLDDIVNGLRDLERFAHDTAVQINAVTVTELQQTADDINTQIDGLVSGSMDALAKEAAVEPYMSQLIYFIDNLPVLNADLIQIQTSVAILNTLFATLETELSNSNTNISPLLATCIATFNLPECHAANDALFDLVSVADFSNVDDVSAAQAAVDAAISAGIVYQVHSEVESFYNLSHSLTQDFGSEIATLQSEIDSVVASVTDSVAGPISTLTNFSLHDPMVAVIDLKNPVHFYGNQAVSSLQFLTSVCLFICALYYIAIIFGIIGSAGTLKHAANLLLAGAGLTFVFGWFVMLVSVVTYATGGMAEGVICRHLVDIDNTADRLAAIGADFFNMPDILRNSSIEEFMDGCRQNESLYHTLDPEGNENIDFNISAIFDLSQYNIHDTLDDIKATPIIFPTVEIMSPTTATALNQMYGEFMLINFTTYDIPLSQPNTAIGLEEYSVLLLQAADELKNRDSMTADALVSESDQLLVIQATTVVSIDNERPVLQTSIDSARDLIDVTPLPVIIDQLNRSQYVINDRGEEIVGSYINDSVDTIFDYLDTFMMSSEYEITNEVGRCRSLYDSVTYIVFGPCRYFLNPLQAVWFTYGWFLAFNIISLAFVFQMANMYRTLAECQKIHPEASEVKPMPAANPGNDFEYGYPNMLHSNKVEPLSGNLSPPPPYSHTITNSDSKDIAKASPTPFEEYYRSGEHPW